MSEVHLRLCSQHHAWFLVSGLLSPRMIASKWQAYVDIYHHIQNAVLTGGLVLAIVAIAARAFRVLL